MLDKLSNHSQTLKHHTLMMLDKKYAYFEENLNPETSRLCNSKIISGKCTDKFCFLPSIYVLTDMYATFEILMEYTLVLLKNTNCFLDDMTSVR